jgi:hypothetical protein
MPEVAARIARGGSGHPRRRIRPRAGAAYRVLVRCCNQVMSRGETLPLPDEGLIRRTGCTVLPSSHFRISAWPSANEKPQAPL